MPHQDHYFFNKLEELTTSFTTENKNELIMKPLDENKRLMTDCYDIEVMIGKILQEFTEFKSLGKIKDVVQELQKENALFKSHQKCLDTKRDELEGFKQILCNIREQSEKSYNCEKLEDNVPTSHNTDSSEKLTYLEQLMDFKLDSRKKFYEYLFKGIKENSERYEREAIMQEHADCKNISFWLEKYEECCNELESLLRKTFDCWTSKEREIAILKKFKKLNLSKMERVSKQISMKEKVIESYRIEKEKEIRKLLKEARETRAAIIIQTFWRQTMVRKHLGPYKIKKKKKKGKKLKRK